MAAIDEQYVGPAAQQVELSMLKVKCRPEAARIVVRTVRSGKTAPSCHWRSWPIEVQRL